MKKNKFVLTAIMILVSVFVFGCKPQTGPEQVKLTFTIPDTSFGTFSDGTFTKVITGYSGDTVSSRDIPTVIPNDGFKFENWTPSIPKYFPDKDTIYRANFERVLIKLTFLISDTSFGRFSDGTFSKVITGYSGERISSRDIPTVVPNDDFEFDGWTPSIPEFFPDIDTTYKANFKEIDPVIVKLTFYIQTSSPSYGSFSDGTSRKVITGIKGEKINISDIPTVVPNDDFEFDGWTPSVPEFFPDIDTTYKANFMKKAILHNIIYHLNGGISNGGNPSVYSSLDSPLLRLSSPIQKGYKFNGWTTDPNIDFFQYRSDSTSGKEEYSYCSVKDIEGDIELYATWYPDRHHILVGEYYVRVYYGHSVSDFFYYSDQDCTNIRYNKDISEIYGWKITNKTLKSTGKVVDFELIPENEQFLLLDENGKLLKNVPNCTDENGNWISDYNYIVRPDYSVKYPSKISVTD